MSIYLKHWGLREKPFEHVPNERYFFPAGEHAEALSRLSYAISEGKPMALLSGEYGTGKTMVCQALRTGIPADSVKLVHIPNPLLPAVDLLGEILRVLLETTQIPPSKVEILRSLKEVLVRIAQLGKRVAVIVDEAHLIKDGAILDELRMLLNYHHRDALLLTLVFAGQSELRDAVNRLPAFRQRIALRCHLNPMQSAEVGGYILHRLKVAGCPQGRDLFDQQCFPLIYKHSGGLPRIINHLCDLALLSGYQRQSDMVSLDILGEVSQEVPSYEEATASF